MVEPHGIKFEYTRAIGNTMIMDRRLLGRIDDLSTGCRDWDMSGYLSQSFYLG